MIFISDDVCDHTLWHALTCMDLTHVQVTLVSFILLIPSYFVNCLEPDQAGILLRIVLRSVFMLLVCASCIEAMYILLWCCSHALHTSHNIVQRCARA